MKNRGRCIRHRRIQSGDIWRAQRAPTSSQDEERRLPQRVSPPSTDFPEDPAGGGWVPDAFIRFDRKAS